MRRSLARFASAAGDGDRQLLPAKCAVADSFDVSDRDSSMASMFRKSSLTALTSTSRVTRGQHRPVLRQEGQASRRSILHADLREEVTRPTQPRTLIGAQRCRLLSTLNHVRACAAVHALLIMNAQQLSPQSTNSARSKVSNAFP